MEPISPIPRSGPSTRPMDLGHRPEAYQETRALLESDGIDPRSSQVAQAVAAHQHRGSNNPFYRAGHLITFADAGVPGPVITSGPHTVLQMGMPPPRPLLDPVLWMTKSARATNLGVAALPTLAAQLRIPYGENGPFGFPFAGKYIDFSALTASPRETPNPSHRDKVANFSPPLQYDDPDGWQGFIKSPLKSGPEAPAVFRPDHWTNSVHSSVHCHHHMNPLHKHLRDAPELGETIYLLKSWQVHLAIRYHALSQHKSQADFRSFNQLGVELGMRMVHLIRMMQVIEAREHLFRSLQGTGFAVPRWVIDRDTTDEGELRWKRFMTRCVFPHRAGQTSGGPCLVCGSGSWRGPDA